MTTIVTEREIRSPKNGRMPTLNSPPAPARAGARIPVTFSIGKVWADIRAGCCSWWALTARPLSYKALWRLSAVDTRRIPANLGWLRAAWHVSNWTDRLAIFALIAVAPTFLTGPLRWLAARPTRRWAFYLVLAVLTTTLALGKG
ncbi:hypothetical protein ABT336_11870 [Micromonospora sp. NPDC000207]|uniref:hypothetical protein n=1 Tax=Micromonospora sp. NPDC000207 TaxID=3154246 RepID=UPI00332829DF